MLVPAEEYRRLRRLAGREAVDAVRFANESIERDPAQLRRVAGLSQAEVASRAGIRAETLSRLENGQGNPTVATVRRILRGLGRT
ncbi:MAG: helix-turn-helix transcriptional regulator [Gemmatimonadota bacterium]